MRDYAGDFEMHLTVRATGNGTLHSFRTWCQANDLKCVHIVLARGEHAAQPMATWRRGATILPAVVAEANRLAEDAKAAGMEVTRVKVEASPHNQDVPRRDDEADQHGAQNYFEHHVKLLLPAGCSEAKLAEACNGHNAHLSRNAFRTREDGNNERFVTLRSYRVGSETSGAQLLALMQTLDDLQQHVLESESEYCVYDTNLALDDGWLT